MDQFSLGVLAIFSLDPKITSLVLAILRLFLVQDTELVVVLYVNLRYDTRRYCPNIDSLGSLAGKYTGH